MKPNILFIFSDQHRFCDAGCYGNPDVRTPCLDALAGRGALMERMYSNCPVCVPARGTLLTGRYPLRHGAITNDLAIDPQTPGVADYLRSAGYYTGYVGKWHLGGIPRDRSIPEKERLGFQYWRGCNCNHDYYHAWYDDNQGRRHTINGYEPVAQTDLALDFIRQQVDSPWALFLSYGPPHEPYTPAPEPYWSQYGDKMEFRRNMRLPAMLSPERLIDGKTMEDWYRGYYAHITALDAQIGRLMEFLDQNGQLDNTLVVYTSDHGDMLGSHGLTNKQWPYEESAHIPFIIAGPGVQPGRRRQLFSLVDVVPTLLGALRIPSPGVDGLDLSSILGSVDAPGRKEVYLFDYIPCHQAYDRGSREWRAVRDDRFLYAVSPGDEAELLFDLDNDPFELENLSKHPAYAGECTRLRKILDALVSENDAFLPWDVFIRRFGLRERWNESQSYFGYPLLP